ncbi:hypothetical protein E2C01_098863 [Portunus trituberculatus]|uniref:Uncharacterized protein n=1 Tax=Portunus trituberculatus TaxID=210409 RepID=A0A5B7KD74_PORTR|nr:hypothetical protein [Portunus trituberculatus]
MLQHTSNTPASVTTPAHTYEPHPTPACTSKLHYTPIYISRRLSTLTYTHLAHPTPAPHLPVSSHTCSTPHTPL